MNSKFALSPATHRRLGRGTQLTLAAAEAGYVTLPKPVLDALAALQRADDANEATAALDVHEARATYQRRVVDALRAGEPLPDLETVDNLVRGERCRPEILMALADAGEIFLRELGSAFGGRIVTDILRPALDRLYAESKKLVVKHGDDEMASPADAMVGAPPAVAKAWQRFGILAAQHDALRRIHRLETDSECDRDIHGDFATVSNDPRDPRLWGAAFPPRQLTKPDRPWPTEPREYLAWLISAGLDLWTPTAAERDARHLEVFSQPVNIVAAVGGPGSDLHR